MSLIWMGSMGTGVEWQDGQHRDLIKQINTFIDAMSQDRGVEDLSRLFKFLDNYVRDHFRREENEMDRIKYIAAPSHKLQHKQFIDNMNRIKNGLSGGAAAHTLAIEARKILADWFSTHIMKIDKQLGPAILQNQ